MFTGMFGKRHAGISKVSVAGYLLTALFTATIHPGEASAEEAMTGQTASVQRGELYRLPPVDNDDNASREALTREVKRRFMAGSSPYEMTGQRTEPTPVNLLQQFTRPASLAGDYVGRWIAGAQGD